MSGNYVVPQALLEAEKQVLGGCLVNTGLLDELDLEVDDFGDLRHKVIFGALRNLSAKGISIDATNLAAEIEQWGKMDSVGFDLVLSLQFCAATDTSVLEYAKYLRDESIKRSLADRLGETLAKWRAGGHTGRELLDETLHALGKLDQDDIRDDTQNIAALALEHIRYLEAEAGRKARGEVVRTGYPTGVEGLDRLMGGWQPGIVSIVCARPGHGKSSLCLASTIATTKAGHGVHVFSMEDPRRSYMNRTFAVIGGIPLSRISSTAMHRDDLTGFARAGHVMTKQGLPWLVDDRSGLTAEDVIRTWRRHSKANKTRLVIVDYLQLMRRSRTSLAKSKHEFIGDIVNDLADAAKADGMALILVSQLNRGVEARDDKRPVESDLRESGTIEERAKCIVALYRGSKYNPMPINGIDMDNDGKLMTPLAHGTSIQLLILKNSQGPAPERYVAKWAGDVVVIS